MLATFFFYCESIIILSLGRYALIKTRTFTKYILVLVCYKTSVANSHQRELKRADRARAHVGTKIFVCIQLYTGLHMYTTHKEGRETKCNARGLGVIGFNFGVPERGGSKELSLSLSLWCRFFWPKHACDALRA